MSYNGDNLHRKQNNDILEKIHRQERGRRRKAMIKRKKARRRNACLIFLLLIFVLVYIITKFSSCSSNYLKNEGTTGTQQKKEKTSKNESASAEKETVKYKIEAPQKRKKAEVYKALKKYAKNDKKMERLYKDRTLYSANLLNKVINNPEMADFVIGYINAEDKVTGGFTAAEKKKDFPLFIQWDKRWAYAKYGDSDIGLAGCGPTCLSMVIFSFTRDEDATPDAIAGYSEDNGFYVDGIGTSWSLMTNASLEYGVSVREISMSEENMQLELDNGNMMICRVGQGDFTTEGHFIVIYGYDSKGFSVNDPYCIARSNKKWSYEELCTQIKAIWSYSYI